MAKKWFKKSPAPDTTPDAFFFIPQAGVELSTVTTSNEITVAGTNSGAAISISGGEYSIDSGNFTSSPGTVFPSQGVRVRLTSSESNSTLVTATLTIGGVTGDFDVTTEAASGTDYPSSVLSASWTVTAQDVYDLSDTANTGPRSAPTKTVGVDSLPPNATSNSDKVVLGAGGGTFSGWDLTNRWLEVTGPDWIIEDNKFHAAPASGAFGIRITSTATDTILRYNEIDGEQGDKLVICRCDAARAHIHNNRHGFGVSDNWKINTTASGVNRPIVEYNYFNFGGWNNPDAHFDCISVDAGGAIIRKNYFDCVPYRDPADAEGLPNSIPIPLNTHVSGRYTYSFVNYVRMSPTGGAINDVLIENNIMFGHRMDGYNPFFIGTVDSVIIQDNIIDEGVVGGMFHPSSNKSNLTWTNNTRYADGATFDNNGDTTVAPSAPFLGTSDSITTSSFRVIMRHAGDFNSHQYALSTDGGNNFGAWTALPSDQIITGLAGTTTYHVKLRGVNTFGNGAESNVVSVLTL